MVHVVAGVAAGREKVRRREAEIDLKMREKARGENEKKEAISAGKKYYCIR